MTDPEMEDKDVYVVPHGPVVVREAEGYEVEDGGFRATAGVPDEGLGTIIPTSIARNIEK